MKVTIQDLVQAGVHFGHEKRKWDPKMSAYILGERAGVYIIDLRKTLHGLLKACDFLTGVGQSGGGVLFVGTKKQSQRAVKEAAERCHMYYVRQRWLGGTLTNFATVKKSIDRLNEMERQRESGEVERYTKKELSRFNREYKRLEKSLGGIKQMTKMPEALVVIDTMREKIAVAEANRLGIPVIAIVDTKCDPDPIDFVIPANDDAIKSSKLLFETLAEAVWEGVQARLKSQGIDPAEAFLSSVSDEEEQPEETLQQKEAPAEEEPAQQVEEAEKAVSEEKERRSEEEGPSQEVVPAGEESPVTEAEEPAEEKAAVAEEGSVVVKSAEESGSSSEGGPGSEGQALEEEWE